MSSDSYSVALVSTIREEAQREFRKLFEGTQIARIVRVAPLAVQILARDVVLHATDLYVLGSVPGRGSLVLLAPVQSGQWVIVGEVERAS